MYEDRGVVCYLNNRDWVFRHDCFDGAGCDVHTYIPLVNEQFRLDQWDVFGDFLSASTEEATSMAARKGLRRSTLLASVGSSLADQVRALRYRSIVRALLSYGWRAMRICLDSGLTANDIYIDPVFTVFHPDILNDVAKKIANDGPWGRPSSFARLESFFPVQFLRLVSPSLSRTWSQDLILFLHDRGLELSEEGRMLCLAAVWNQRRDRFSGLCEGLGIATKNAVYEVYRQGCDGAFDEVKRQPDARVRYLAFSHAFIAGKEEEARELVATLGEEYASKSLSVKCAKRMVELESILTGLLLDKLHTPPLPLP